MTLKRWFGYRAFSDGPVGGPDLSFQATFGMDFINMHDGDTIERALCGYRLETVLVDNSSGLEKPPFPWQIGFTYVPTPDSESEFDPGGSGGDALFRDFARWRPHQWTDGTFYSTKWWADSGGMISVQGGRTVRDKTTAEIHLTARADVGSPGFDGSNFVFAETNVELWIEILVRTNFG